ncbi:MAG TPA: hypothetical protein VKA90_04450 [Beijerinckiaceae bacterium]|nr:hypothetical protein [Beijerinckiaceae bacterium]
MLILHILPVLRIVARLRKRRRKAAELGPGTMVWFAREAGVHGLRRQPHV